MGSCDDNCEGRWPRWSRFVGALPLWRSDAVVLGSLMLQRPAQVGLSGPQSKLTQHVPTHVSTLILNNFVLFVFSPFFLSFSLFSYLSPQQPWSAIAGSYLFSSVGFSFTKEIPLFVPVGGCPGDMLGGNPGWPPLDVDSGEQESGDTEERCDSRHLPIFTVC